MLLSLYTGIGFASFCMTSWSALTGVFCKSPAIDMLDNECSIPDAACGILPIEDQLSKPICRNIDALGALCKLAFDIVKLGETIPLGVDRSGARNSDLSIVLVALEVILLLEKVLEAHRFDANVRTRFDSADAADDLAKEEDIIVAAEREEARLEQDLLAYRLAAGAVEEVAADKAERELDEWHTKLTRGIRDDARVLL